MRGPLLYAALLLALAGCTKSTPAGADAVDAGATACPDSACPELRPRGPLLRCADGSIAGFRCARLGEGCGWVPASCK